jgi:hypothetical protein
MFQSYQPIDCDIKTVDRQTLKAIRVGNVQINLLNRNKTMPVVLKGCIHTLNLAFTLISVSQITCATKGVNFKAGHAVITHPKSHIMAKILESQGLYYLTADKCVQSEYANVAISKMSLMEAHCKLGHIACTIRGHPSVSLLPLSSPTLPLFICTSPIPLYHLQGTHSKANDFRTHNPTMFQKSAH